MQKKSLFFAGAVLCLLVSFWLYRQYQKPRTRVAQVKAEFSITADALYHAFNSNETDAEKKYGGKVLQVQGIVAAVQPVGPSVNVLLASGTGTGGVNCSLAENATGAELTPGVHVMIKGRCAGFLMDVSLVDAVRVK
jgi:hypothetical protein